MSGSDVEQGSIHVIEVDEVDKLEGEIDAQSESRAESRRVSSRSRTMTERGLEYEISLWEGRFKASVSRWRSNVSKMSVCLSDENDPVLIRSSRNALDASMEDVQSAFNHLIGLRGIDSPEIQSFITLFEGLEEENQKFMCKIADRICEIQQEAAETASRSSRRSYQSSKSRLSKASYRSRHSDAAAEAAALKAKLKYIDAEMRSKAEFEKITTQRKLEMAQAKIGVLDSEFVKSFDSLKFGKTEHEIKTERTREYVMNHPNASFGFKPSLEPLSKVVVPEKSNLDPLADQFLPVQSLTPTEVLIANIPKETHIDSNETDVKPSDKILATVSHKTCGDASQEIPVKISQATCEEVSHKDILELTKTLAEQACLSRLPPPEPSVFDGDPLKYPAWKSAFQILIEQKRIPSSEKIHYLRKYLSGSVKEVIENFFLLTSEDAYEEAKKLLEERYGDPFVIGNAFRNKLEKWPKIQSKDSVELRRFADFLKQCETAMGSVKGLSVLNDDRENRKMLLKIPEWLVNRWNRLVSQYKEKEKQFPPFKEFVSFIEKEAKIACDPVTSLNSLRLDQISNMDKLHSYPKPSRGHPWKGHSLLTEGKGNLKPEVGPRIEQKRCSFCQKTHDIDNCFKFLAKTLEERKAYAREKRLCFSCLGTTHVARYCRQRKKCSKCGRQHPTSLHGDKISNQSDSEIAVKEVNVDKHAASLCGIAVSNCISVCHMSSLILPVYVSHEDCPGKERLVYALLDSQSDTTFILEDTSRILGLSGVEVDLMLSTMHAENKLVKSQKFKGLSVRGFDSSLEIKLPVTYSREIMPANRSHIPTPELARKLPHLSCIADYLLPLQACEIGLLIGYNCAKALMPRDVIAPDGEGPYAQKTDLGWGIVGIVEGGDSDSIGYSHNILAYQVPSSLSKDPYCQKEVLVSFQTKIKEVIEPCDVTKMMELEFSENKSDGISLSLEDRRFLNTMQEAIHKKDKHYEMPLPFKHGQPVLPNNRSLALHRLKHLQKKLEADERYRNHYVTFMKDILDKGHAEIVPETELRSVNGKVWYIPHHGVYHHKKKDKVRIVFDRSAKFRGESLNDHLLQGPDLTNTLVGVLNRFRKEPVAFICDVEQMFHQFRVNVEDRNYLRFMWWKDEDFSKEPVEFRMCVHLFGAVSSPGCANYGLKQVASDNEDEFGSDVANFLRRDFYVDDGLKSLPTVEGAKVMIDKCKDMCAKGGLHLHKFVSNSKDVLNHINPEDRAKGTENLDLLNEALPVGMALGIQWCVESDSFQFHITLRDRPFTRRGILSTLNSVYDPLGFLGPVLLSGKQILQQMCKDQTDWDTPLPENLGLRWHKWTEDLCQLEKLEIQRCVKPNDFGQVQTVELHHFSDASTTGYGQCSYIRLINEQGRIHCALLMGKARVTPLKPVTVPRLELVAALLSVKISVLLQKELEYENIKDYFWTDSSIVLSYISNESRRFHVFVANRVQQIRNHTEPYQWRHVVSSKNPADMASRGVTVLEFMHRTEWFSGPKFLWEKSDIEAYKPVLELSPNDPEVKKVRVLQTKTEVHATILDRLNYFSGWQQAKKAIARCLKLKESLLKRVNRDDAPSVIKITDIEKAEVEIIKHLQEAVFEEEIHFLRKRINQNSVNTSEPRDN